MHWKEGRFYEMKLQCILLNADAKLTNVNNQRKDLDTYVPIQDQGALYHRKINPLLYKMVIETSNCIAVPWNKL